jgi:type III secretory pathway component EscV
MKKIVTTTEVIAKESYKYIIGSAIVLALGLYWNFSALTMLFLLAIAGAIVYFLETQRESAKMTQKMP